MEKYRKIIHVDMDAFYASVEVLDNPELIGKAVVVGSDSNRGVIAAASYEARKYGIRSAMASVTAKKKCKSLIFIKPRMNRYREVSKQIKNIFFEYTNLVEPLSLDEAYLDVSNHKILASDIAFLIRKKIFKNIGITASAGISINKFVAKMATNCNKPNGQKTIHPLKVNTFIDSLPIDKFFGIGKVTAKKMRNFNIHTGSDLRKLDLPFLIKNFGKSGKKYFDVIRNNSISPVNPNRIRKSIGVEHTFKQDLVSVDSMKVELQKLCEELEGRMKKKKKKGRTITLKLKYSDFTQLTRSHTKNEFIKNQSEIIKICKQFLYELDLSKPVRLLGVSLSKLNLHNNYTNQINLNF